MAEQETLDQMSLNACSGVDRCRSDEAASAIGVECAIDTLAKR